MRKQIIFLLILNIMFLMVKAQQTKQSPEERAKKQTELLTKELNLSQDQADKIYQINVNHFNKLAKLRNSNLSKEEEKQKIKDLLQQRRLELKKVLTKEQMEKLKELLKKMKELKANY